jgi:hypothetical protein
MSTEPLSLLSLDKADEIIAANPKATQRYLVAIAYCDGRLDAMREVRRDFDRTVNGIHEYDCICQRCGRRAGSRHVVAADAPPSGYFEIVCFHCSANDEPRAA